MTIETCMHLCRAHIIPDLGRCRLRELSAEDVDRWLAAKAKSLSTRTLQALRSCLSRSIRRAITRDKVNGTSSRYARCRAGGAGAPQRR